MISVAVVGYGLSARTFHIPFILASQNLKLLAVSTSQEEAGRNLAEAVVYPTAAELLRSTEAQLVVITSPNDAHYELALESLRRGKHVVIEKPFVTTVEEGERLIALAADKGLMLSVYHNRRWDGDFLTAKKLIETGDLGEVRYFESHFDRFRPNKKQRWREQPGPGSGTWFDLGSHLLDQALCLFGKPEALTGRCLAIREDSGAEDYFHVQLHYPRCEVILHASPFRLGPNLRFQVQGSRQSYIKYGMDPQEERLRAGAKSFPDNWAGEPSENFGTLYSERQAIQYPTLMGGYQHFYHGIESALIEGAEVPVTGEEALQVVRLIRLAQQSSLEGRTLTL